MDFVSSLSLDNGCSAMLVGEDKLIKLVWLVRCASGEGELSAEVIMRLFIHHII